MQSLTKREIQILIDLCVGCNKYQIADKLRISHHTVNAHMRMITHKLAAYDKPVH